MACSASSGLVAFVVHNLALRGMLRKAVIRIGAPGEAGYRWHGGIMR